MKNDFNLLVEAQEMIVAEAEKAHAEYSIGRSDRAISMHYRKHVAPAVSKLVSYMDSRAFANANWK